MWERVFLLAIIHTPSYEIKFMRHSKMNFLFLEKLWCCVGGRDKKKLALSNELIKDELPP